MKPVLCVMNLFSMSSHADTNPEVGLFIASCPLQELSTVMKYMYSLEISKLLSCYQDFIPIWIRFKTFTVIVYSVRWKVCLCFMVKYCIMSYTESLTEQC